MNPGPRPYPVTVQDVVRVRSEYQAVHGTVPTVGYMADHLNTTRAVITKRLRVAKQRGLVELLHPRYVRTPAGRSSHTLVSRTVLRWLDRRKFGTSDMPVIKRLNLVVERDKQMQAVVIASRAEIARLRAEIRQLKGIAMEGGKRHPMKIVDEWYQEESEE